MTWWGGPHAQACCLGWGLLPSARKEGVGVVQCFGPLPEGSSKEGPCWAWSTAVFRPLLG